ncbi:hypothetical protein B1C78_03300 [Thioalkalivibrio denitrificans]|uniref:DUF1468 domain-containing protein n=1 Tax=Thioalkalivibrio denitrificans TaxID=108003 RepID=A0A1V3NRG1_9GAMM|nr:tripartite tricarboxylate transporter TctB family protein [Thioalkalivibrio denitrificans]OOG27687.1 hypothetical protein B1C78_03300 [Thioalkalivibrio denitrificans]
MNAKNFNTDIIAGLGALGLALVFWFAREPWTPLSARWPNAILVFIFASAAFLLVRAFIRPERGPIFDEGSKLRMLIAAALLILWASLIEHLGFMVTSVLVFYGFWWYVTRAAKKVEGDTSPISLFAYLRAAVVTVLLVGSFHFIFTKYLYVPLPRGILM